MGHADNLKTLIHDSLNFAKKHGATAAEMNAVSSDGFTVNVRLGEIDTVEYHRDKGFDITVYMGEQQGCASTTDLSEKAIQNAIIKACSIAKATGADPCHGLAEANLVAREYPNLDLYYPWDIDVSQAVTLAQQCENAGREFNAGITNSEGASVSKHEGLYVYGNTHDFIGDYRSSRHSVHCVLLAENKVTHDKERDYEFTVARDPRELASVDLIGRKAAEKTLARLNGQKLSTRHAPVVFAPHVACGLLGHFTAAVRGSNIYRQSSFLAGYLGKKVFPDFVSITENPHVLKAIGSAPFDTEGVLTQSRDFIKQGILESYILDSYSARKLGLTTTGNAGGVRNLEIKVDDKNKIPDNILKKMGSGLLVTEVMGQGVNIMTGDYSRGAAGFWVENGEIQYPVHEITIASTLPEMFSNIIAVGQDVDKRGHIWSGSVLIDSMKIAGE